MKKNDAKYAPIVFKNVAKTKSGATESNYNEKFSPFRFVAIGWLDYR